MYLYLLILNLPDCTTGWSQGRALQIPCNQTNSLIGRAPLFLPCWLYKYESVIAQVSSSETPSIEHPRQMYFLPQDGKKISSNTCCLFLACVVSWQFPFILHLQNGISVFTYMRHDESFINTCLAVLRELS